MFGYKRGYKNDQGILFWLKAPPSFFQGLSYSLDIFKINLKKNPNPINKKLTIL